jgi:ABC-type polysaccharide/polyol phosphate export permease
MSAALDTRVLPSALPWRRLLDLIRISALRQLKARYRGTALGVMWSFANPLLMTVLYTAIFGTAFASYYGSKTTYVLSAFLGVAVATFFLQATGEALAAVVTNGGLLNKIAIDPEIFPIASVAANSFQQSVTAFPVILVLSALLTHDPVRVLLVPVVLAGVVALVTGFGLVLAALYVFFRDLSYLWGIIGFVFWMTSPVFYPAELVPEAVRRWIALNPVAMGISALREVTLGHGPLHRGTILAFLIVAIAAALVGHAVFRALRRDYMDLL